MTRSQALRAAGPAAVEFLTSVLAGLFFLAAVTPARLTFGTHVFGDTALLLAVGLVWLLRNWESSADGDRPWLRRGTLVVAGAWALLAPALTGWIAGGLQFIDLNTLASPAMTVAFLLGAGLVCLVPGLAALFQRVDGGRISKLNRCASLAGLLFAGVVLPWTVFPAWPMWQVTAAGCGLAVLLTAWNEYQRRRCHAAVSEKRHTVLDSERQPAHVSPQPVILAALAGGGLAVAGFAGSQLITRSLATDAALWSATLVALTLGGCVPQPRSAAGMKLRWNRASLGLGMWIVLLPALYPLCTWSALMLTARQSQLTLLHWGRCALLIALHLPGLLLLGRLMSRRTHVDEPVTHWITLPAAAAFGYGLALWSGWSAAVLIPALAAGCVLFAAANWVRERSTRPTTRGGWIAGGATLAAVLVGTIFTGNLQTRFSERVLFSTQAFAAARHKASLRRLGALDDARLLAEFETLRGRTSLWRYRGAQVVTRRNGLPLEFNSTDPQIVPRSVGDMLPTLLPLVLHDHPSDVLLLGAHVSSMEVCQASPLRSVQVWEGDEGTAAAFRWRLANRDDPLELLGGPLFEVRDVAPAIAVRAGAPAQFDVIALPQAPPVEVLSAGFVQREFYENVRRHLTASGIFSQRLDYYDLGPQAVRDVVGTIRSVFGQVFIVESLPGELVCLASSAPLTVDTRTVERLQAHQCRQLLGEAGWDWAVVLGRGGLSDEAVVKFLADRDVPASVPDGRLAWQLPREVARWAAKSDATRQALSANGKSLWAALDPNSELVESIVDRISLQSLAFQLQAEHPDEPWGYRAALKERLQERPATVIEAVKYEGVKRLLHPDEKRRKDYLLALGEVATVEKPPIDQVLAILDYSEPFDPLLSQFARFEAATLLDRAGADPHLRLRALLHTVYFGPGTDRSVRNLCAALDILCEHPDLLAPTARWDHLNGLLQLMSQRWQLRLAEKEQPEFDAQDTALSAAAVERALGAMDGLSEAVGVASRDWSARREVLEQSALRPIQTHRAALLYNASRPQRSVE